MSLVRSGTILEPAEHRERQLQSRMTTSFGERLNRRFEPAYVLLEFPVDVVRADILELVAE